VSFAQRTMMTENPNPDQRNAVHEERLQGGNHVLGARHVMAADVVDPLQPPLLDDHPAGKQHRLPREVGAVEEPPPRPAGSVLVWPHVEVPIEADGEAGRLVPQTTEGFRPRRPVHMHLVLEHTLLDRHGRFRQDELQRGVAHLLLRPGGVVAPGALRPVPGELVDQPALEEQLVLLPGRLVQVVGPAPLVAKPFAAPQPLGRLIAGFFVAEPLEQLLLQRRLQIGFIHLEDRPFGLVTVP
jgi:hypothetical protein